MTGCQAQLLRRGKHSKWRQPSTLKVAQKRFSLIAIKCENLAVPDYESQSLSVQDHAGMSHGVMP